MANRNTKLIETLNETLQRLNVNGVKIYDLGNKEWFITTVTFNRNEDKHYFEMEEE